MIFLQLLYLSHLSFQFMASSATPASAQMTAARRENWKRTAAEKRPVQAVGIYARGPGRRTMTGTLQWFNPAERTQLANCWKINAMKSPLENVLSVAVTPICVTRARLFPSACSWWPFAPSWAWHYLSKPRRDDPGTNLMSTWLFCRWTVLEELVKTKSAWSFLSVFIMFSCL